MSNILVRQLRISLIYEDVKLLAEAGKSLEEAATMMGVPYSSLWRFANDHCIVFHRPAFIPRPRKPLDDRYFEIRSLKDAGWTNDAIGKLYMLSRERVRQILKKGADKND